MDEIIKFVKKTQTINENFHKLNIMVNKISYDYLKSIKEFSEKIQTFVKDFELILKEYDVSLDELNFDCFNETNIPTIKFLCDEIKRNEYKFSKLYSNEFSENDFFKDRSKLIQKGLEHFEKKDYISSIPLLLSQFEGIVWEYGERKDIIYYSDGWHYKRENNKQIKFNDAYEMLFNNFSSKFIKGISEEIYHRVFRHQILHGKDKDYDKPENNFILVFVLFLTLYYIKDEL